MIFKEEVVGNKLAKILTNMLIQKTSTLESVTLLIDDKNMELLNVDNKWFIVDPEDPDDCREIDLKINVSINI